MSVWGSLTADEQAQLQRWNETTADFPQVCVHELFERQAARDPAAVAVTFRDNNLTYGELNARANRLAHRLRRGGVRNNVLVGVCLERCPDLVVALLAVWKAGGAYVPLDPSYPKERLSFMVEDAQPLMVLTSTEHASTLAAAADKLICLDTKSSAFSQEVAGKSIDDQQPL